MKTTPTQLVVYGKLEPVPTESVHSYVPVSLAQEGNLYATKREA